MYEQKDRLPEVDCRKPRAKETLTKFKVLAPSSRAPGWGAYPGARAALHFPGVLLDSAPISQKKNPALEVSTQLTIPYKNDRHSHGTLLTTLITPANILVKLRS